MTELKENINSTKPEQESQKEKNDSEKKQHRNPFEFMRIEDNQFLNDIDGRMACSKCKKSRKFFCYSCCLPVKCLANRLPKVKLPVKIDIIKHHREIDGKSTAIHAAILAADDVNMYTYPDIPDYTSITDETVLIFPTHNSIHVYGIFDRHVRLENVQELNLPRGVNETTLLKHRLNEIISKTEESTDRRSFKYTLDNLPIKRAVFIDSTWNQCNGIFKDPRIHHLRTVVLQNRLSQFWRHQKCSPRWFLATIEAIHQFLLEVHINAWGLDECYRALGPLEINTDFIRHEMIFKNTCLKDSKTCNSGSHELCPYNGQYDNLFFFFSHMYRMIHAYYDHNELKAYRRPIL